LILISGSLCSAWANRQAILANVKRAGLETRSLCYNAKSVREQGRQTGSLLRGTEGSNPRPSAIWSISRREWTRRVILTVGDVDPTSGVTADVVGDVELAFTGAGLTPRHQQLSVRRVFVDAERTRYNERYS
jgi:hypothetical protein